MGADNLDVFINAPFDEEYKPILHAIVFAVVRYGYRDRCAVEVDDASGERFSKICAIIQECRFGIHDICRTETDGTPPLPRFNLPLELGLFLGAQRFGGKDQKRKVCLVLDRERHRYQKFISDISGQDIHSHGGTAKTAVKEVTEWLRGRPGATMPGGGAAVWSEYQVFKRRTLKAICDADKLKVSEMSFRDYNSAVALHAASL